MSLPGLLDIAISLICLYLLLSLICTTINEFIATLFKLRARWLASAIEALIDNPTLKANFRKHGLIATDTNASIGREVPNAGVGKTRESYLDSRTFAMAILGSLDLSKPTPVMADIQDAVGKLPAGRIKDVLTAQLTTAAGDVEKLRGNIAEWFDSAMDRLSGSYKRWLKWISLSVGIALALALNADSFAIGTALWKDETLRAQIVNTAVEITKADSPSSIQCADEKDLGKKLGCQLNLLRPFPIGWNQKSYPEKTEEWLAKIFGCLVTGLALSLGAPFWFDVLQKFMNVRGAGVKPTKEEEKKK